VFSENPASAAPRQLVLTSQFGTLSATAPLGQGQMPTETVATANINRRDMTISWTAGKVAALTLADCADFILKSTALG